MTVFQFSTLKTRSEGYGIFTPKTIQIGPISNQTQPKVGWIGWIWTPPAPAKSVKPHPSFFTGSNAATSASKIHPLHLGTKCVGSTVFLGTLAAPSGGRICTSFCANPFCSPLQPLFQLREKKQRGEIGGCMNSPMNSHVPGKILHS